MPPPRDAKIGIGLFPFGVSALPVSSFFKKSRAEEEKKLGKFYPSVVDFRWFHGYFKYIAPRENPGPVVNKLLITCL